MITIPASWYRDGLVLISAVLLVCGTAWPTFAAEFRYRLPADIVEFASSSPSQRALQELWDTNINTFTLQGKMTNPWTQNDNTNFTNYVDPKVWRYPALDDFVSGTAIQPITWSAFPNRIVWYFNTSQDNPYKIPRPLLYPLIDQGRFYRFGAQGRVARAFEQWVSYMDRQNGDVSLRQFLIALDSGAYDLFSSDLSSFTPISVPTDIFPTVNWKQDNKKWIPFGPPGPRGWKDEYNEWVVTRDIEGKIVKISFTAENPEYWFTLWKVDPNKVLELYRQLVSPGVTMQDLVLKDAAGRRLRDITGNPAYNPLNKWNYGNDATEHYGGAAHLTSPPNTVGAEITLAANGTMVRHLEDHPYSPAVNLAYSLYGQAFRNSDPNIGFQVNQIVKNLKKPVTLTNPVSLYMQRPNFANYRVTSSIKGYDPEDFFTVVRGKTSEETGRNYDEILHATMQVPAALAAQDITLTDALSINGIPLWWGSQVAETFNQALAGTAFLDPEKLISAGSNKGYSVDEMQYPRVADKPQTQLNPAPQPLVANKSYQRLSATKALVTNSACLASSGAELDRCLNLSSATIPVLPTVVRAGTTLTDVALVAIDGASKATIEVTDSVGRKAANFSIVGKGSYSNESVVPGQHSISQQIVYVIDIMVGPTVPAGHYGFRLTNPGMSPQQPLPAALIVTE